MKFNSSKQYKALSFSLQSVIYLIKILVSTNNGRKNYPNWEFFSFSSISLLFMQKTSNTLQVLLP